jgi:hypothetical protein
MRQDQYEKLQALEEQLADVFIAEAEPAKWPGAAIEPANMDAQTRGDRYWCKKNAVATLSLIQRVGVLIGSVQASGAGTTPAAEGDEAESLDADIKAAEKEAAKLMRELQSGTTGAAKSEAKRKFDKKAHGRAAG